jgi:hypothetical protein
VITVFLFYSCLTWPPTLGREVSRRRNCEEEDVNEMDGNSLGTSALLTCVKGATAHDTRAREY